MAEVGQLNVRLEAQLAGLERGLQQGERAVAASTQRMGDKTDELSQKLGIGGGGLVASAFRAFAVFSKIELGVRGASAAMSIMNGNFDEALDKMERLPLGAGRAIQAIRQFAMEASGTKAMVEAAEAGEAFINLKWERLRAATGAIDGTRRSIEELNAEIDRAAELRSVEGPERAIVELRQQQERRRDQLAEQIDTLIREQREAASGILSPEERNRLGELQRMREQAERGGSFGAVARSAMTGDLVAGADREFAASSEERLAEFMRSAAGQEFARLEGARNQMLAILSEVDQAQSERDETLQRMVDDMDRERKQLEETLQQETAQEESRIVARQRLATAEAMTELNIRELEAAGQTLEAMRVRVEADFEKRIFDAAAEGSQEIMDAIERMRDIELDAIEVRINQRDLAELDRVRRDELHAARQLEDVRLQERLVNMRVEGNEREARELEIATRFSRRIEDAMQAGNREMASALETLRDAELAALDAIRQQRQETQAQQVSGFDLFAAAMQDRRDDAPDEPVVVPPPIVEAPSPIVVPAPVVEAPSPVVVPSPIVEAPSPVVVPPPVVHVESPPVADLPDLTPSIDAMANAAVGIHESLNRHAAAIEAIGRSEEVDNRRRERDDRQRERTQDPSRGGLTREAVGKMTDLLAEIRNAGRDQVGELIRVREAMSAGNVRFI